jgi:hypothetical protein
VEELSTKAKPADDERIITSHDKSETGPGTDEGDGTFLVSHIDRPSLLMAHRDKLFVKCKCSNESLEFFSVHGFLHRLFATNFRNDRGSSCSAVILGNELKSIQRHGITLCRCYWHSSELSMISWKCSICFNLSFLLLLFVHFLF